ncbi:MAG: abortive infection family protein [Candidatus Sulfotelmatobacter sp.]
MKISERSIKRLGEIITGDKPVSPYRSGPQLVSFFNEFGTNHTYGQGFPSRWMFAESCIRDFNDTPTLKKIIVSALDPRDFMGTMVFDLKTQERKPTNLQEALTYVNEFLAFDGYEIVPHGKGYDVVDKTRGEIVVDVKLEPSHLSHAFIMEQIEKCRTKMSQRDYDGAITNARSLVEAVLAAIEKEFDSNAPDYDGDLPKLYKRVQKHLNLSPENPKISNSLKQTLTGFISIIGGLSGLSNKMGDRHVREYKPAAHHAALIVNAAMTFSNFIFDTYAYQKAQKI